jgi:HCOMODA/2-hydroxy-3-carboxy-muconic semialdehyde decarboxylase
VSEAVPPDVAAELEAAGRVLAACGLVTAFGHVAVRIGDGRAAVAPPPLGRGRAAVAFDLDATELPAGVPGEAFIHGAILRARPDVIAVCRAQPPVATAVGSTAEGIVALHGQGAFLGERVAVHDDARLVRSAALGEEVATALGSAPAVLLRGNGAVTTGPDIAAAVARMWVLERSAEMNRDARAAGTPQRLSGDEIDAWNAVEAEILGRIWNHLRETYP